MSELLQIFQTNPLTTFIGRKIEAATRPELDTEDWALNIEICDLINENEEDGKDAAKAIKKRLQQSEQDGNFVAMNRTLTLLDTCVNNCSHRFHVLVMTKDFISGLVKLIGPKNCPPIQLQERVLGLIQRWAEAFRLQPDLGGVSVVYNDLKLKGVTFPEQDPSSVVPIQTPERSVHSSVYQDSSRSPDVQIRDQRGVSPIAMSSGSMIAPTQQHQTRPLMLTGPDYGGLNPLPSEIQLPPTPTHLQGSAYSQALQEVQTITDAVGMFNDVVANLETSTDESDWSLADSLFTTCEHMERRVMSLVGSVTNEDLVASLIKLNEDLMQVFSKYQQLILTRTTNDSLRISSPNSNVSTAGSSRAPGSVRSQPSPQPTIPIPEPEVSLIDLDTLDEGPKNAPVLPVPLKPIEPSSSPSAAGATSHTHDAVLQTKPKMPSDGTQTKTKSPLPTEVLREQDLAEIENWLATDSVVTTSNASNVVEHSSIPNSEFDDFIANRALAGASGSTSTTDRSTSANQTKPSSGTGSGN